MILYLVFIKDIVIYLNKTYFPQGSHDSKLGPLKGVFTFDVLWSLSGWLIGIPGFSQRSLHNTEIFLQKYIFYNGFYF